MVKQFPKLSLVTKDDQQPQGDGGRVAAGFELVSLEDLSNREREQLQATITSILPKATLIAAARTPRAWDLRPVVTHAGESNPSIIRFTGPTISSSPHLFARMRETLDRLKGFRALSSALQEFGIRERELWFRRPLVEKTLAHQLSSNEAFDEHQTFSIVQNLADEVFKWHERGVVHAHITSTNIVLTDTGRVSLLDAGIGLALVQSAHTMTEYNPHSFAPELLGGQTVVYSSDLYGLGLVFRRLFVALAKRYQLERNRETLEASLKPFVQLSNALLEQDPALRPSLSQVRRTLEDEIAHFGRAKQKSNTRVHVHSRGLNQANQEVQSSDLGEVAQRASTPASPFALSGKGRIDEKSDSRTNNPKTVTEVSQEPLMNSGEDFQSELSAAHISPNHVTPPHYTGAISSPPGAVTTNVLPPQQFMPGVASQIGTIPGQELNPPVVGPYVVTSVPPGYQVFQQGVQQLHAYPHPHYPHLSSQPNAPVTGAPLYSANYPYQHPGAPVGYAGPSYQVPISGEGIPNPNLVSSGSHVVVNPQATLQKTNSNWLLLSFCAVLSLVGLWYYRVHGLGGFSSFLEESSLSQYREDWSSRIPSRMLPVALAAVSSENPSREAEAVIVGSARNNDQNIQGVNDAILRIAFNDSWEVELSPEDRRVALALALGGLLKQKLPKDLPALDKLHPAVILAVTSSVGSGFGKNVLGSIPAPVLAQLPPPYGPAFKLFTDSHGGLSCGDESVQRLARLATRSVEVEEIALFLKDETILRLRTLALLYSQENAKAQTALEIILSNQNVILSEPTIEWAKSFKLGEWTDLSAAEKLLILAGISPTTRVSNENLGRILAHPVGALRAYALTRVSTVMKFAHPGAIEVFHLLSQQPDLLNPEQTVKLIKLLLNPIAADSEDIKNWLTTNPADKIVISLLIATANEQTATALDHAFAVYLKGKDWKPEVDILRKLMNHPDDYARFFAYDKIYLMEDRETAREFLSIALKKEKKEEFRQRLNQLLLDVN